MASFKCVVLLSVLFCIVIANPTINNVTATPTSIVLQNSTKEFAREKSEEFFKLFEKNLPVRKLNREINSVGEFWKKRNALADSEVEKLLGNDLPLNVKELKANKIILSKKYMEFDKVLSTNETFPPSITFSQGKSLIEQSEIFKIIRKIPKGARLYNMMITAVSLNFMYYNLTFENNLYFRFEDTLRFIFSRTRPAPGWRLLSRLRNTTNNSEFVDDLNRAILDRLNLVLPNSEGSTNASTTFEDILQLYINLTSYRPNFIKTFTTVLETLDEDNIMYAEMGYHFPPVYDLDGNTYNPIEVLTLCQTVLDDFMETHVDFIGFRFLYVPVSALTLENLSEVRKIVTNLWKSNPRLIAGFGFISLVETDMPWSFWVEEFLQFPKELALVLDAGVTNNWGIDADYDFLDAITLNAVLIGGGIAINKHPLLLQHLRKMGIPIVVFPIYAQSTNSIQDFRTHAASIMVATNTPMVIGNAAGTIWNDTGLSYDWYMVYLAMTPRFCDLRCLKQFAVNSLLYSNLSNEENKRAIKLWQTKWGEFIDFVIENYNIKL